MHYSDVAIHGLLSIEDCEQAEAGIYNDPRNTVGGHKAFYSGYATYMLKGAEKKLQAIQRRSDSLFIKQLKQQHKEYLKEGGALDWSIWYEGEHFC